MTCRVDASGTPVTHRRRRRASLVAIAIFAVITAGCSTGNVVTTDNAPLATATSSSTPPSTATPITNDRLANAFDYFAEPEGRTGYYFISPSKRWACAIFSRVKVGCQSSTGSAIPITGAPKSVLDGQGLESAPNTIELARDGDVQFVALDPPEYALEPGPAAVLPFGKVLIVAGFQCNIQEATGISCQSQLTGKGFTFSADGYTPQYSDLPA